MASPFKKQRWYFVPLAGIAFTSGALAQEANSLDAEASEKTALSSRNESKVEPAPSNVPAQKFASRAEEYFFRASDAEKKGDCVTAIKYYKAISRTDSFGEFAAVGLANCYLEQQKLQEAEDSLTFYLRERNPFAYDVQKTLVIMLINQSRFEDANKEINVALKLKADDLRLQGLRAMLLRKQTKLQEALVILNRIITADPSQIEWRQLRAEIFYDQKNFLKASQDYEVLNSSPASDANIKRALTWCYIELQNWKAAIQVAKSWVDTKPNDAKAWELLGDALVRAGEPGGRQAYEKSLSVKADQVELRFKLVNLLTADRLWEEAVGHLRRITDSNKDFAPRAAKMIVSIYKQLKRRDELGVFLKRYLDTRNDEAWAAIEYVKVLDAIGRTEFAEDLIGTSLSVDSKDRGVRNAIALILAKVGRTEDAKKVLLMMQAEKVSPVVSFNLGLVAEQSAKLDEAIKFYQQIPKDSDIWARSEFNRALCVERLGNKQAASVILAAIPEDASNAEKVKRKLNQLNNDLQNSSDNGVSSALAAKSLEDLLPYRTWEYEP